MAAIADPSHATDLEKFGKDMEKALPPYARPVFLRFLPEVNKTGTVTFSPLCSSLLNNTMEPQTFPLFFQEHSSSRRRNCAGMVLTHPRCQTDCTSWIPAEGAICA